MDHRYAQAGTAETRVRIGCWLAYQPLQMRHVICVAGVVDSDPLPPIPGRRLSLAQALRFGVKVEQAHGMVVMLCLKYHWQHNKIVDVTDRVSGTEYVSAAA